METKNVEHLFIFSTLNQMTNYIAIKNLKPKNIYNITFDEELVKTLKQGIQPDKWDENLEKVLADEKIQSEIKPIKIKQYMYEDLEKFKNVIKENIKMINKDTPIYWHITGGQRVFSIAIHDIVKERPNDIIFYLEGNSEKIISIGKDKHKFQSQMKYELEDLDFSTAFKLMGYDTKDLKSTKILKGKINKNDEKEKTYYDEKEMKFYNKLYQWIIKDGENPKSYINVSIDGKKFEGTFKKLLLESNSTKQFISRQEYEKKSEQDQRIVRQEFLVKLFEEVKKKIPNLKEIEYDFIESDVMRNKFPAGYIFEKLTGYEIYTIVKKLKHKIQGIAMGLKVYCCDKDGHSTDELDIVILTNTGRIINFECKSGSLKGDNAKSHNFTTYSLSGVFGAPIFLTPLTHIHEKLGKELEEKLQSACGAAERAKLEIIYLEEMKDKVEKIIG